LRDWALNLVAGWPPSLPLGPLPAVAGLGHLTVYTLQLRPRPLLRPPTTQLRPSPPLAIAFRPGLLILFLTGQSLERFNLSLLTVAHSLC